MAFPKRLSDKGHRGRVTMPAAPPRERDVLALVPPTEDIRHLDRVWRLDGDDPWSGLLMWWPTDEGDKMIKNYLLTFAAKVVLHERRRVATLRRR